jgi:hypothetical protein|tara:strand:+ start:1540 stop:1842 length:303 start_codon:yes stop_codon:yes gene_type:complete
MITTVSFNDFRDAFKSHDRLNNFTIDGLIALFNALEDLEESIGEKVELDVIAFCVEFQEFESLEEYNKDYSQEYKTVQDLADNVSLLCEVKGGGFITHAH